MRGVLKAFRATSRRRNRLPEARAQTAHPDGDRSMISRNLPKRPAKTQVSVLQYPQCRLDLRTPPNQRHKKNIITNDI
jgi:hypothetical protein